MDVRVIEAEEFDKVGEASASVGSGVGEGKVGVSLGRCERDEVGWCCIDV